MGPHLSEKVDVMVEAFVMGLEDEGIGQLPVGVGELHVGHGKSSARSGPFCDNCTVAHLLRLWNPHHDDAHLLVNLVELDRGRDCFNKQTPVVPYTQVHLLLRIAGFG